jgi:hypothetical protein
MGGTNNGDNNLLTQQQRLEAEVSSWVQKQQGFFAPYRNKQDVLQTVFSPVTAPVGLALLSGASAVAATCAALACIGSLFVAGIAALSGNKELRDSSFEFAASAATIAAVALASTVFCALMAAISAVITPIRMLTRTIGTIVNGGMDDSLPDFGGGMTNK